MEDDANNANLANPIFDHHHSAHNIPPSLPPRPGSLFRPLLSKNVCEIQLSPSTRNINVPDTDKLGLLDNLENDETNDNNGESEIGLEEVLNQLTTSHGTVSHGCETSPELSYQDQNVENQTAPAAVNSGLRLESQFVESVTLCFPCASEPDMTETDTCPIEDSGETGDGQHPVEGLGSRIGACCNDVAQEPEAGGEQDGDDWTAISVNVAENFRSLTAICEGGHGTRRPVNTGISDGQDGDENDNVHD